MHIAIASDHRGLQLKKDLEQQTYILDDPVIWDDLGPDYYQPTDDYVDYAVKLVEYMKAHSEVKKGVLICGSGVGMSIVANKFIGIRCGLAVNAQQVHAACNDDDINLLAVASDYFTLVHARVLIEEFLKTSYSNLEAYQRRLDKIRILEEGQNG